MTGVSGSSAVRMSVTGVQFLVFNRDDFRRVLCDGAAGRHDGRDGFACQQTWSIAIACCGADLRPFRCDSTPTHGVMTAASCSACHVATTPGTRLAAVASIPVILAWAWGERRNTTCAIRGSSCR